MDNTVKQMMDMRPGKGITRAQSNEHKRDWTEKGWLSALERCNIDPSRSHLNFEVVKGGKVVPIDRTKPIDVRMAETLAERGIIDPNEGLSEPKYRTVANFIFGGNQKRLRQMAFGNQMVDWNFGSDNSQRESRPEGERSGNSGIRRCHDIEDWACDIYRFVADKWGEENIVGFCVHLDETNPHIHCTLLPIDKDNKFAYKKMSAGKSKYDYRATMIRLHDELAAVNEPWGLARGDSILLTGARHRTSEEYRRALTTECTTLEDQIDHNQDVLSDLQEDLRLAQKRVRSLNTMVTNLEAKKSDLEAQMQELSEKIRAGEGDVDELQRQIADKDIELQKVIDSLADKTAKREAAISALKELKEQEITARSKVKDADEALHVATSSIQQQVKYRLTDVALDMIVEGFNDTFSRLDTDTQQLFAEMQLLQDMAQRGNEIITCAVLLYANYVDRATQFAETHGGGGGSSQDPFSRKDDEDDRAWARRCMLRAHRMMRPSPRGVKRS